MKGARVPLFGRHSTSASKMEFVVRNDFCPHITENLVNIAVNFMGGPRRLKRMFRSRTVIARIPIPDFGHTLPSGCHYPIQMVACASVSVQARNRADSCAPESSFNMSACLENGAGGIWGAYARHAGQLAGLAVVLMARGVMAVDI